jgi:hypothetical protein
MNLPIFQIPEETQGIRQGVMLLQTKWAAILNSLIANPSNSMNILPNISLVSGTNTINHLLGHNLRGWIITRMIGSYSEIYDLQNTNQMPGLTLVLVSSAPTICDIGVF